MICSECKNEIPEIIIECCETECRRCKAKLCEDCGKTFGNEGPLVCKECAQYYSKDGMALEE